MTSARPTQETHTMTDDECNEAANVAAHKYRWVVWLAVPAVLALAIFADFIRGIL